AESRVVQWLLRKSSEATAAGNITGTIEIPMAKRLLASQLGITSETFSRVLAHLRDEQLITIDGKEITLLDTAKLTLFASSQPLAGVYPNKPAQRQAE